MLHVAALGAGLLAQVLIHLIGFFTNVAIYHRFSIAFVKPADDHSGWATLLLVPVIGGLIVATFVTLFVVPAVYTLLRKAPPSAHELDAKFTAESSGASEASHA